MKPKQRYGLFRGLWNNCIFATNANTNENSPECLTRPKRSGKEAYLYGWGPNEYVPTGSLGNFEYIDRLGEISCPGLLFSGSEDLCTPAICAL